MFEEKASRKHCIEMKYFSNVVLKYQPSLCQIIIYTRK